MLQMVSFRMPQQQESQLQGNPFSGCMNNNPYEPKLTLPELVDRGIKAETENFDKVQVKFLDHFCLKLSMDQEKAIQKGSYEVERCYLRKALGNTTLTDPDQLSTALQILYYLTKKQHKSKDYISPEAIQEIIKALSKLNKYEWNKKSEQRVEKRFKNKLEDLLKAIRKDGTRDVKSKLQVHQKNQGIVGSTHKDITNDLAELVQLLQTSEGWKEAHFAFPNKDPKRHLIELFYEMKLTQEEAVNILCALRTLINPKGKGGYSIIRLESNHSIFDKVVPNKKERSSKDCSITSQEISACARPTRKSNRPNSIYNPV